MTDQELFGIAMQYNAQLSLFEEQVLTAFILNF